MLQTTPTVKKSSSNYFARNYNTCWAVLLSIVTCITLVIRYALPIRDGDIWFHLVYGEYFIKNKTLIPDHTIFSWSPATYESIYCTWLSDIVLYLIHAGLGLPGLFGFRYLCYFIMFFSGVLYAKKVGIIKHPLTWLSILFALLMSYTAAFAKPEVFTFAYMTLTCWNWFHIRATGDESWKNCYYFPLIMLAWVNSHGGFIFGLIFISLVCVGETLNTWLSHGNTLPRKCRKHLSISFFLTILSLFLTPYNYQYLFQVISGLIPSSINMNYYLKIAAYANPFEVDSPFNNFTLYANFPLLLLLFAYYGNFKERNIEWSSLLTNIFFAYLYSRFLRSTFYWAPVFLFSSIYLYSTSSPLFHNLNYQRITRTFSAVILTTFAIGLAGHAIYQSATDPEPHQYMGFGISEINPVNETAYIKKYFPYARIGNTYNQGAYLLWQLWPSNKVFFDARHFPYREWSDEFFDFIYGNNVAAFLAKYPADIWMIDLSRLKTIMFFFHSDDWELIFYGKNAAIFCRSSIIPPSNAATVSPDITKVRNITTATHLLAFLCAIHDWSTAEELLAAMSKTFHYNRPGKIAIQAYYFYDGVRLYYRGEYQQAYDKLLLAHPEPFNSTPLLINCLLYLSGEAWKNQDDQKALSLNKQVLDLYGFNLFSLYNMGVIQWNLKRNSGETVEHSVPLRWKDLLTEFINNTPKSHNTMIPLNIAHSIMNDQYDQRPSLLIPKYPETLRQP